MSNIKAVILSILLLSLLCVANAQEDHQGESFTLNGVLTPFRSHEYTASQYIDLYPGFSSIPSEGNTTDLKIDPYLNPPDGYGLTEYMPEDHDIIGRLGFYPMDFHVNECGAATISMPLEFPEGIKKIGWMCFTWADALEEVIVPASVKTIEQYAFAHCPNLKKVTILNPWVTMPRDQRNQDPLKENIFRYSNADAVLCGPANSNVQKYAESHGLKFEALEPAK